VIPPSDDGEVQEQVDGLHSCPRRHCTPLQSDAVQLPLPPSGTGWVQVQVPGLQVEPDPQTAPLQFEELQACPRHKPRDWSQRYVELYGAVLQSPFAVQLPHAFATQTLPATKLLQVVDVEQEGPLTHAKAEPFPTHTWPSGQLLAGPHDSQVNWEALHSSGAMQSRVSSQPDTQKREPEQIAPRAHVESEVQEADGDGVPQVPPMQLSPKEQSYFVEHVPFPASNCVPEPASGLVFTTHCRVAGLQIWPARQSAEELQPGLRHCPPRHWYPAPCCCTHH
jgi:hypothetical protein